MNNFSKTLFFVFLVLITTAIGSASTFGTLQYETSARSQDLNQSFKFEFFNPGEQDLRISLSAETPEGFDVVFSKDSFLLEGQGVTSEPTGSGWYSLGNGSYAKLHEVKFWVYARDSRDTNDLDMTLRVEAQAPNTTSATMNRIVQVQEYSYSVKFNQPLPEKPEKEEKQEEKSWKDNYWREAGESVDGFIDDDVDRADVEVVEDSPERRNNSRGNASESYKSRETDQNIGGSPVNSVTFALLAGIVVTVGYLFKVL